MARSGAGIAFKIAGFGCLGLVGLVVLVTAIFGGIAFFQVRSAEVEERDLTPALGGIDAVEPVSPGLVVLQLGHGGIRVVPGDALEVHATYDTRSYELIDSRETREGYAWVYRVGFRPARAMNLPVLRAIFGDGEPRIEVKLPRGTPLSLDGNFENGHSEIELGGLHLIDVDLTVNKGAFVIQVSEPTGQPVERFQLEGKMGAVFVRSLGNASPRELKLSHGMGALLANLEGRWVADSNVSISLAMGNGELELPDDVTVTGLDGDLARFNVEPDPELAPPTLHMNVHCDMGEIEIRR